MSTVELHAHETGSGDEAVVLAHAIGLHARMWIPVMEALAPRYRVIAFDARGHGMSPVPPRPYTLAAMADDAAALLDRLGIRRAHWVGLSMGGMVGQAFALSHPRRLGRLVLANTTASYGTQGRATWQARAKAVEEGGLAAIADTVRARYFSEAFRQRRPEVVDDTMARFLASPVQGYLGCCDAIAELDFSRELARIGAPTMVIAGGLDVGTPPAMSEALAAGIPGARLTVLRDASHLSAVEEPEAFSQLVGDFLAG